MQAEGLRNFVFQSYQPAHLLSDSLAAADVHFVSLLPALEGLIVPSKVYGILAAGRATIFVGDPAGDLANMLHERRCGLAVSVGDGQCLADELRALRDYPERLHAMGLAARELACSRYSTEHAAADWMEFLGEIAPATIDRTHRTLSHAR